MYSGSLAISERMVDDLGRAFKRNLNCIYRRAESFELFTNIESYLILLSKRIAASWVQSVRLSHFLFLPLTKSILQTQREPHDDLKPKGPWSLCDHLSPLPCQASGTIGYVIVDPDKNLWLNDFFVDVMSTFDGLVIGWPWRDLLFELYTDCVKSLSNFFTLLGLYKSCLDSRSNPTGSAELQAATSVRWLASPRWPSRLKTVWYCN